MVVRFWMWQSPIPPEDPPHLQSNNDPGSRKRRHIFKHQYVRVDEMGRRKLAMPVQIVCPNLRCRKLLSVPDDARGKIVKCHHCQTVLRVPAGTRPQPAAPVKAQ
jgi:LSD1 subclass zinc finger protein